MDKTTPERGLKKGPPVTRKTVTSKTAFLSGLAAAATLAAIASPALAGAIAVRNTSGYEVRLQWKPENGAVSQWYTLPGTNGHFGINHGPNRRVEYRFEYNAASKATIPGSPPEWKRLDCPKDLGMSGDWLVHLNPGPHRPECVLQK